MVYRYHGAKPLENGPTPDARQRILNAAIELYGEHGFETVTLKAIAQHAGVSAPLVIHHFGSSAGLRRACDRHVAEELRQSKSEGVHHPGPMPRYHVLDSIHANRHVIKYLLNAFAAGGEEMDALFDKLVDDALEYTAEAEELGLVYPSANPRNRVVVMLLQSFGALMLHKQMKRQLGASPIDDYPESLLPYISTVLEIFTQPVINAEMYESLMTAQQPPTTTTENDHD